MIQGLGCASCGGGCKNKGMGCAPGEIVGGFRVNAAGQKEDICWPAPTSSPAQTLDQWKLANPVLAQQLAPSTPAVSTVSVAPSSTVAQGNSGNTKPMNCTTGSWVDWAIRSFGRVENCDSHPVHAASWFGETSLFGLPNWLLLAGAGLAAYGFSKKGNV